MIVTTHVIIAIITQKIKTDKKRKTGVLQNNCSEKFLKIKKIHLS